MKSKEM